MNEHLCVPGEAYACFYRIGFKCKCWSVCHIAEMTAASEAQLDDSKEATNHRIKNTFTN